jgi:hydrogenase maturation protease
MNLDLAKKLTDAVLYEGYILYPYRASAIKNRQRFNFGVLMPGDWAQRHQSGETGRMLTECLVEGEAPRIDVRVRFLQLVSRDVARACSDESSPRSRAAAESIGGNDQSTGALRYEDLKFETVPELEVDGEIHQSWEEAVEREIVAPDLGLVDLVESPSIVRWSIGVEETSETLEGADGRPVGAILRRQNAIEARLTVAAQRLGEQLWKVRTEIENVTRLEGDGPRAEAQLSALASAHTLLAARAGQFVSLLEPPDALTAMTNRCENVGAWPVLVGETGERDLMLASPVILYDYPQVAPESDGDYFDGTEMDEMLALRVMTLTDDEKRAMRSVDRRAREILERTESLSQSSLMHLHGTIRERKEVRGS